MKRSALVNIPASISMFENLCRKKVQDFHQEIYDSQYKNKQQSTHLPGEI